MKMKGGLVFLLFFIFYSLLPPCLCSVGDEDSLYRSCVEQCEKTNCKNRVNGANSNGSGASISFFLCFELGHAFPWVVIILSLGLLQAASTPPWDMEIMKMFDYSSALALLGFSLLFTIIRTFNLRIEVARVMVAAPIIGFVSTHILYLNVYEFDHGWNVKVSIAMEVIQLGLWIFWAGLTCHPSRFKLWFVIFAGVSTLILEKKYDFPPLLGWFDAHSLRLAAMVPLTYLWWSFVKDDALFRTKQLQQRNVTSEDTTAKKVN